MYDVCIIGGGPAGSTLARLLSPRLSVLLVDRRELDSEHCGEGLAKACGGLLAPSAQRELARQGLGLPADVVSGPQLFAVRCIDRDTTLRRTYQRYYTNIDREAFDRWLVRLAVPNVDCVMGWSLRALERGPDETLLRFDTREGGRASVSARVVVGADGATSLVRRAAWPDRPLPRTYAAVQAEFSSVGSEATYGAIFDTEITDFYGWTIPKGGALLVGAAFSGPNVSERFDAFVRRLEEDGCELGAESSRSAAMVIRPRDAGDIWLGDGSVVLLGEAAGLISPSSAEGISYALASGAAAASALNGGLDQAAARYRHLALPLLGRVSLRSMKSSLIYLRHMRHVIMRSGVGSIGECEPRFRAAPVSL